MKYVAIVLSAFAASSDAFAPSSSGRSPISLSMGLEVGDKFPQAALEKWGVSGKNSVVYFYGADDAPSCKKQNAAFDDAAPSFKKAGIEVVGVRNEAGDKGVSVTQKLVVDEDDQVRNEIGINKDLFGLLGGRETYVVNAKGMVEFVFNSQFKPEEHVSKTLDYASTIKKPVFSLF